VAAKGPSRELLVGFVISAATVAVYAQTLDFDFVSWDDHVYVASNAAVQDGLSLEGVAWAFTSLRDDYWIPLTWLSHMLDAELYGMEPAGHHATAALLHLLNSLLLFTLLRRMTGELAPSALAAGLFALHPLRVEAVAWVSERKEILSTAFGLLALHAYLAWTRRGGRTAYLLALLGFACALMAKPMLVTLPFALLLLDYWPLGRLTRRSAGSRIVEKLPFFALSAASCVVTLIVQRPALAATPDVALPLRLANASVSCVRHLVRTFWPGEYSILYPHPYMPAFGGEPWAAWQIASSVALLLAVTALALRATRQPWLLVGWLWYLGTLVPVIGVVQLARQGIADRHTYVPLIGIFVIAGWGAGLLVERMRPRFPQAGAAAAALCVAILALAAWSAHARARAFRDSRTLYEQSLRGTPDNPLVHYNLAMVLRAEGRTELAIQHYRAALAVNPDDSNAHNNLATALQQEGRLDEALHHFRESVRANPRNAQAQQNLAGLLYRIGDVEGSIDRYRRAVELAPGYGGARYGLGVALATAGRLDEAIEQYQLTLQLDPANAAAHNNLGLALLERQEYEPAIQHLRASLAVRPRDARTLSNLGKALILHGDLEEAVRELRAALEVAPDYATAHTRLGIALAGQGDAASAVEHLRQALVLRPGDPEAGEALRRALAASTK
jgi:tetratricopeptide (TPR) repeat protein